MVSRASNKLPTTIFVGALVLVGSSLILSAYARHAPLSETTANDVIVVESRSLQFVEHENGTIAVFDTSEDRQIAAFDPKGDSFVTGVFKGLAYSRHGSDATTPYQLNLFNDGRLALFDPVSGESIDLGAFGVDNARAFVALIAPEER